MSAATLFGEDAHLTKIHLTQRTLHGADESWGLPLCWHAGVAERMGEQAANDDEAWWLSVDHGVLEPSEVIATTDREAVTCPDCREWMHA